MWRSDLGSEEQTDLGHLGFLNYVTSLYGLHTCPLYCILVYWLRILLLFNVNVSIIIETVFAVKLPYMHVPVSDPFSFMQENHCDPQLLN